MLPQKVQIKKEAFAINYWGNQFFRNPNQLKNRLEVGYYNNKYYII